MYRLGGVGSPDGKYIYGVPGHHKRVLRINIKTEEYDLIGPIFKGQFKWLRGVQVPKTNSCYCMPSNATQGILKIDGNSNVTIVGNKLTGDWLWHGGVLACNNHIYAIPCDAHQGM